MKFVYSMIKNMDKSNLVYPLGKVETIAGQEQEGEKERAREGVGKE